MQVRTYDVVWDEAVLDELWARRIGVVMTVFYDAAYQVARVGCPALPLQAAVEPNSRNGHG